jgi:hypothetical protein
MFSKIGNLNHFGALHMIFFSLVNGSGHQLIVFFYCSCLVLQTTLPIFYGALPICFLEIYGIDRAFGYQCQWLLTNASLNIPSSAARMLWSRVTGWVYGKNRPKWSPTYFLSKLIHNWCRGQRSPEMCATTVIFKPPTLVTRWVYEKIVQNIIVFNSFAKINT